MDENKEYDINSNIGRMRAAHFKVLRERLALPMQYVADQCGATRITVARWESGATRIPPAAATVIRALDNYTHRCVDAVVDAARGHAAPMVVVWERAEEMPPGPARELGPRWWRVVAARAAERVPTLIIGYPRELDRLTGSRERVMREAIGLGVTPIR
jgi:hypothetical protein